MERLMSLKYGSSQKATVNAIPCVKQLAIIGASYLQAPLIQKAKDMGLETHVFAWAANDVGEKMADHFYPISIIEKDKILAKCQEIGIDGICTIASDLAVVTVNYVADKMKLVGNSLDSTLRSTNKHEMRKAFQENGDPSPKSLYVEDVSDLQDVVLDYPVIVKPVDRSGSRGITKLNSPTALKEAIEAAKSVGFDKHALVEEFAEGQEYSVECLSYRGEHNFLTMTKKYTTGAPHFIETGHMQPAPLSADKLQEVKKVIFHALDSLKVKNGASHSELKIDSNGRIRIIEIGARMGGDFIGSNMVQLSTGIDFVGNVVRIAMGMKPDLTAGKHYKFTGVHFILTNKDLDAFSRLQEQNPELLQMHEVHPVTENEVTDSSTRFGYFLMAGNDWNKIVPYMPDI